MAEVKEVTLEKLATPKNKVFFPGKAVLSDKEAETLNSFLGGEKKEAKAAAESPLKGGKQKK